MNKDNKTNILHRTQEPFQENSDLTGNRPGEFHAEPVRPLRTELGLFSLWAAAGLILEQFSVQIPFTDVLLDGRWIFGFIGFALLQRSWLAILMAALLSIPFGSTIPLHIGFFGNLLYAVPSLITIRLSHRFLLDRIRSDWVYAPVWFLLVVVCYQAFVTPAVWAVIAWMNQSPISIGMIEGWTIQPFLIEILLVGFISTALIVSYRSSERLRINQLRLDHINRILRAISNINQLIVSDEDPHVIADEACSQFSSTMGYDFAWMVLFSPGGECVEYTAFSGDPDCKLPMKPGQLVMDLPACIHQTLADQDIHVFSRQDDCSGCPAESVGIPRIHMLRRLAFQNQAFGVLSISAAATYQFDPEELSLFEEASNDLEYAFHKIRAAENLRQSEQVYRQLFENMAQGVVYQDHEGRIISANPAAERILGISTDQMQGKTSLDPDWMTIRADGSPLSGEDHPAMIALRTGQPVEGALMGVRGPHKKATAWILVSAVPEFRPGESQPYRVFATFEDITRRRRAEKALEESESRYHGLFESIRDAILVTDQDHRIIECNQACTDLFGYSRQETIGENLSLLYGSEVQEGWEKNLADNLDMEPTGFIRVTFRRKDGSVFPAEMISYPLETAAPYSRDPHLPQSQDSRDGCITLVRDISQQIEADAHREKIEAQLRQAQKMESVGQLAGGIAHDFNNMLSIILGQADLALMGIDSQNAFHAPLFEIRQAAERSADLTRQLLAFARKQTIDPIVLDLNSTIEDLLKMLRRLIGEDINLSWIPGETWPVKIDPSQLNQILTNLCVNSREAIQGVGRIIIETTSHTLDEEYCANHSGFIPGDFSVFAVSDDGCGMDRETSSRIFEPFFTTREGKQKTGLGLSMVYGIVKQNEGFINVYSEPGEGTTFRIYLPHYTDSAVETRDIIQAASSPGKGERILLVEDEPGILGLGRVILERLGYDVLALDTPGAALSAASELMEDIHLLITDVVMPEMNGRELAAKLQEQFPGMKVLFMSGYTANVIAHRGVLDEGVHFLQKPFLMGDLSRKVREALDEP